MANVKISDLVSATIPLTGAEVVPLVQNSTTKKVTVAELIASLGAGVASISAGTTGLTPSTPTAGAVVLGGVLNVANGGTGTSTPSLVAGTHITITGTWPNQTINSSGGGGGGGMVYPAAGIANSTGTAWGTSYSTTGSGTVVVLATSPTLVTPLLGTPTSGNFSTGTFTWPTFNQNTTGNAANVTGTVAILNGGSGQTTAQAAMNAFAGAVTSGSYLRGNGTNVVMAALAAADMTGTLAVNRGGTGVTTSTGSGNVVLSTSPTLVTPVLGTPTSGTLSGCTVDGINSVGYLNIPQNSQSVAYTLVLADAGKHILHPSADTTARTFTIPANSSVAYVIGTAITFVNQNAAGVMTIAITTDTMRLAGAGTTGSRTLAANGVATAIKLTATEWIISGTNLT
jgi:hypothetical protein